MDGTNTDNHTKDMTKTRSNMAKAKKRRIRKVTGVRHWLVSAKARVKPICPTYVYSNLS